MTRLRNRKSKLKFETENILRGRPVVAQAHPDYITVRLKGQRTSFDVSWSSIYYLGAKVAADIRREEKRRKRG